jgi:hypothetical protein
MTLKFPVLRYAKQPGGRWRADLDAGGGMTMQFFTSEKLPNVVVGESLIVRWIRVGLSEITDSADNIIPTLRDLRLND